MGSIAPLSPARRSSHGSSQRRTLLPWPDGPSFRILSLDGGGIKGVYTAAFLAELEQAWLNGRSIGHYFDMIVGTSTGGIIALALANGMTATDIVKIYVEDGKRVFPYSKMTRGLRSFPGLLLYRYKRKELNDLLANTFGDTRIRDLQTRVCVPSFDGHHGEVYIFKTPHHPDFHLDAQESATRVGAATSAAPTFFRPLNSNGYQLIDGGVWANNPVMIGLTDALSCFAIDRPEVQVLSIGCGRANNAKIGFAQRWGGMLAWRGIIFAAMDLASQNALGQTGLLIGRENLCRVEPATEKNIAMDDYHGATSCLIPEARDSAKAHGPAIYKKFLTTSAEPVKFFA